MPEQAIALKRCASCDRWQGERNAGPRMDCVTVADDRTTGLCKGGPWDGQSRRARSACGHWIVWHRLSKPAPD